MFNRLTERFDVIFGQLRRHGKLSERNIEEALREIRRALLEADVNFQVVRAFIQRIKEQSVGQKVLRSLSPGQQVIKIVHAELVALLGANNSPVRFSDMPPTVIMLVGLQGCGKTTIAGKLARYFSQINRPTLLVAGDVYRPAAADQLQILGASIEVPVFSQHPDRDPIDICSAGLEEGRRTNRSVVILDTAGRLSIDSEMMAELTTIRERTKPHEIFFVADAMLGQDAVETARRFHDELAFTGCVLSKMDSDARGGAALSIRQITGEPIKFVGTGEQLEALEAFHPDRMASRVLGMGDVLSLVEKAEQAFEREQTNTAEQRLRKERFTFEDFLEQLQSLKKMGPVNQIMDMIPGMGKQLQGAKVDDNAFSQTEAIIRSMTRQERVIPQLLNSRRRRRIARGSGTTIQDVNRLVKQFQGMQKMMRRMNRMKPSQLKKALPFLG